MIDEKRLVNTFKKLVKIDSLSLHEGKVVKFLVRELRALGLKPRQVGRPQGGEVGSLILDIPGKEPCILLNAHMDTVGPGKGIKPVEKGKYIVPAGKTVLGADNKAGVSANLEILRVIKERKLNHPHLRVIFTVAEEIGLVGARALPKKVLSADFGLTVDGGDIHEIIHKAPSQDNIVVTVHGKAAHAGIHPEDGVHAIKVAATALAKMKLGRIDYETTANIGVIEGGKATNIIPDKVILKGEVRSHSLKKLKKQIEYMKNLIVRTSRKHKAKAEIKITKVYRAFEIKKNHKVLRRAVKTVRRAGIRPVVKRTGGGSDANIFNAAGIPTIIVGVGADHVHTTSERIAIRDLVRGTSVILDFLLGKPW